MSVIGAQRWREWHRGMAKIFYTTGQYQMLVGLRLWKCLIIMSPRQECTGSGSSKSIWRSAFQVVCSLRWFTNWRTVEATLWVDYYWLVYKFNVLHLSLFHNFALGRTFIRRNQQPNCQHRHRFTIRKLETWTSCKWVFFFGSRCCLIDISGNVTLVNYHFNCLLSSYPRICAFR